MRKLPHSLFITETLRPTERFDAWKQDISTIFDVEDPCFDDDEQFHASFDLYNFGQSVLAQLDSSAAKYLRSRQKILSDGMDSILLQLFLEGGVQFGSGKQTTYAGKGDIVVFDLSRPVENFNSTFKHITMMMPRDVMDAAIPNINRWHGMVLPLQNPAVPLLRNLLTSSFEMAPRFDLAGGRHVEAATISLAAAAMSGNPHHMAENGANPHVMGVLTHQIKRHIRSKLSGDLTPEALASTFGVSRAQIYRLMEPLGGISTYIRHLRLHRCMAELCDPLLAHLNVSEIAYRSGFNHLNTFNRSFRETFGMTPSQVREKTRLTRLPTPASGPSKSHPQLQKKHHEWFRDIGF